MKPMPQTGRVEGTAQRAVIWQSLAVGCILILALVLRFRNSGHPSLTLYDESFHAIVSQNLLKHPLRPTLIEHPWLPFDELDWRQNHIWLHKGIIPHWQIAASFFALGVNTFALRLPSCILSGFSVVLTFLIGRRLLGAAPGLVAAALQAINPSFLYQVHGLWFSDHVDVALLFWLELAILLLIRAMESSGRKDWVLAGAAQGIAFLCKSYVGLLPGSIACVACVFARPISRDSTERKSRIADLFCMHLATLATIAPWSIWCWLMYPAQFKHELLLVGRHLNADIEGWSAPWDRLHFDYSLILYAGCYVPVIVATAWMIVRTAVQRTEKLLLLVAWGLIVQVVFTMATSKTPAATLIAMPAFLLILAAWLNESATGNWSVAATMALLSGLAWWHGFAPRPVEQGYPDPAVAGLLMRKESWVIGNTLAGLGCAIGIGFLRSRRKQHQTDGLADRRPRVSRIPAIISAIALAALCIPMLSESWALGTAQSGEPTYQAIANDVRSRLEPNAALLVKERIYGESRTLAFYCDRTCYLCPDDPREMGRLIRQAGGIPYILTAERTGYPLRLANATDRWRVYECP